MARAEWKDEYSVKNEGIDEQHKQLLSILNRMEKLVEEGGKPNTMAKLLTEMSDYALAHFKAEEQYMERISYPKLEEHKELHSAYTHKVLTFTKNYLRQDPDNEKKAVAFLKSWWVNHILQEDMEYSEHSKK